MSILFPFLKGGRGGESGNVLLLTGLIATSVAVTGGKVMLDRTLAQRKANQLAENTKRAKEIPGSAAMIAKALISLPPQVASNKAIEWTTPKLVSTPANMPLIYPIPYVSGTIGSTAQPASTVKESANPPAGANWAMVSSSGLSATVKIFINDSTRGSTQAVNSAINSKSVTGGNETLKRTESLVTYSFRNCNSDGTGSASFTGRYCARANIKSQNWAGAVKGSNTQSGVNEAVAELGLIEPPPAPVCGVISTPGNVSVRPGDTFSLDVNATGVAIGYEVKYGATPLQSRDLVSLPWNNPRTSALHTITGIPTDTGTVKSALTALLASGVNQATFELVLKGVNSPPTKCPFVVTLPGPVSCVPNSFTLVPPTGRTGDDLRTCQMSLRKDSGEGTVTAITVGGQTFTGDAAAFSGDSWSGTIPCSQDALQLTATLTRNVFGAVSTSECSPSRTVPELAPDCVANSLDGGRDPSNLMRCNITLKRDQKSHSVVTVNTTPALFSGSWSTTQNADRSWTWQGVIDPCPLGSVNVAASLSRGSSTDSCGTKTISDVEPAKCNGPPTGQRNIPSNPGQCRLTVNKFTSSGPIKHVTIDGTSQPSSGNYPSPGAWGTGDSWTSPWFTCPLTSRDYDLSLVGLNDAPSSCGTYRMPVVSYALTTSVSGQGLISKSPDSPTYPHGTTITLTASPIAGHSFTNWGGACSGTSTTCTVIMNSAKSVVANFVTNTYTLTTSVSPASSGTISRIPNATNYNHGSVVTLTATPLAGYSFTNWGGACSGTSTTCTLTMDSAKSVVANFGECFNNATGGTTSVITVSGIKYRVHQFSTVGVNSGTIDVIERCKPFEVLVVAGGGGGGTGRAAGGGGAGGVIYNTNYLFSSTGSFPVTVGAGGAENVRGANSSISNILVAQGGGYGGRGENQSPQTGGTGGSGGGGGFKGNFGAGLGTTGQGFNGGKNRNGNWIGGGGGGGSAADGKQAGLWSSPICSPLPSCGMGGAGGNGLTTSISGTSRNYAGGGSGCGEQYRGEINSFGGGQGGKDGVGASSGVAGTGGGGGGCGGAGGSGVVIIRYKIAP